MHTKVVNCKDIFSVAGGHNWSHSGLTTNFDASFVSYQDTNIRKLNKYFSEIWG